MLRFSTTVVCLSFLVSQQSVYGEESDDIAFVSHYLTPAVASYHRMSLIGQIGGSGQLILDPNACALDAFGDPTVCTLIAPTNQPVKLVALEIADPTGQGRRLYAIDGHGLDGDLRLVVTRDNQDASMILTNRTGERTVIALDRQEIKAEILAQERRCRHLPRKVDGTTAEAKLIPGFVNDTWILVVAGKKFNLGTSVEFEPVIYVQQPEYWEIRINECSEGIVVPTISSYVESQDVTNTVGKKGVDVVFTDDTIRLQLP